MKIVQIIPNFGIGGAETMCAALVLELRKLGHEVIVISMYDYHSPITERLEKEGVGIIYLGKKLGFDPSIIWKIRRILKKEKPDAVHTHLYACAYGMIAAILAGVKKRVNTLHSVAEKESRKAGKRINKSLYKHHHVIPVALSKLVQDTVVDVYGLPKERIPVVYNGIDLSNCIPKESYSVDGKFKIVHVGSFTSPKNHPGLLKAFKTFHDKHPDSELWLVGDGVLRPEIEKTIGEYGLGNDVKLLGLQSNVYGYLHDADMFTLPSNYEGIPMTIIEAMGTGLPVAATSVGGIPDMLENGKEAILVENDPIKIADAFEQYYLSEDLRRTYGQNAKKRSIEFSAETMAKGYLEIYQK